MLESEMLVRAKSNGRLGLPHFHVKAVKDEAKSEVEGRQIFNEQEFVEIHHPGDLKTRPCFPVTEEHRQLWPEQYQHWKKTRENKVEGFPLEEWPRLGIARVAEFKAQGILTVEQLSNLADDVASKLGATKDKAAAKLFLKPESEAVKDMRKENQRLESRLAELEARLEQKAK